MFKIRNFEKTASLIQYEMGEISQFWLHVLLPDPFSPEIWTQGHVGSKHITCGAAVTCDSLVELRAL